MTHYEIRYCFDAGSGICLWAANDAARDRWGYAIAADALSLPPDLGHAVERLVAWYDQSIDWSYPPNPSPWSTSERERFNLAAQSLLHALRTVLGTHVDVVDASGTAPADP